MKTLVLQLARLGDIYQTWPVLRALRRGCASGDEIHLAVRERFRGAAEGIDVVDRLWNVSGRDILGPLVVEPVDIDASLARLDELCGFMRAERFDRVINLSFSPFSSRLVAEVVHPGCEVRGYARHPDGYLDIPDDASAYFFAQAGPGRANRVHLTDLFAMVAGVELEEQDWSAPPDFDTDERRIDPAVKAVLGGVRPIVIHVGASQSEKSYGAYKWLQVVKGLVDNTDTPVVLVGSNEERASAQTAANVSSARKPVDLCGKTSLRDLYELVGWARLVIGADSAPVHIAALTGTPVLNLSFAAVNLWETGPRSARSRILYAESPQDLASDLVVNEALSMIDGRGPSARAITVRGRRAAYDAPAEFASAPAWDWLQAIYMGADFPPPESELCAQGLMRLSEANSLALEQLDRLAKVPGDATALGILDRYDEIIETIARLVPTLGCLIRWFQTERIRLGPMPGDALLSRTRILHLKLDEILKLYATAPEPAAGKGSDGHDDINLG